MKSDCFWGKTQTMCSLSLEPRVCVVSVRDYGGCVYLDNCDNRLWQARWQIAHENNVCADGVLFTRQGLSDLFSFRLLNDDVQDFDVRWDQALLYQQAMCLQMWSWKDCTSQNYRTPVQLQTVLALYDQENRSKQWPDKLFTIGDVCKTSYWSGDENSKLPERCCGTRSSHQESKRKESLRGEESGRAFSLESTWTMFTRKLMKFQSWQTCTRRRVRWLETKKTIVFSRTKGVKILKNIRQQRKISLDKRSKIPCCYKNCNNPSCTFGHPPVFKLQVSETGCTSGRTCFFKHVEAEEKPSKKSKKDGAKRSAALLEEST